MDRLRPPSSFETARLLLRPVVIGDSPKIFQGYAGDAEATRFMNFPRHRTLASSEAFAQRCVSCWEQASAFPWVIEQRETAEFIGVIELRPEPPKADFGYILCPAFWGRGYATEAAAAIVDWSIRQPEIHRVWAICCPENVASARVLEKAGLSLEARLAKWQALPNIGEAAGDHLVYALVR